MRAGLKLALTSVRLRDEQQVISLLFFHRLNSTCLKCSHVYEKVIFEPCY